MRISISALVVVVLVCQSTVLLSHVTCCNSTSQAKYGANFLAPHPPLPLYSSPPLSVGQGKLVWLVWQLTEFDPVTMSRCWHHVYKPCDHIGHGMWPVRHVGRPPIGRAETQTGGTVPSHRYSSSSSLCEPAAWASKQTWKTHDFLPHDKQHVIKS